MSTSSASSLKPSLSAVDLEKQDVSEARAAPVGQVNGEKEELKRQMSSRHVALISIGGAIGTGLFLGTATALRNGGPLGLLLGYSTMGFLVFAVMSILGELASHLPIAGGVVTYAARFVNAPFGFICGWWYWYCWALALPAELSASAVLISYWDTNTNPAVYISVTGAVAIVINFGGARAYGEMEFWFASIKVITIVGLIILGVVLMAGGGPSGEVLGGKYWVDPGPFTQYLGIEGGLGRFLGYWTVLTQAAYSFIGSEVVALAAAEAKNPKKTIPSAIKKVWIRIVCFYVLGVWVVGMLVPSNDSRLNLGTGTAASSPFVIAIKDSGIKALPSVINAALLTSAWSAASSDLYVSSRALAGLALQGNAPRCFARTNSWGVPWLSVAAGIAVAFLAYMSCGAGTAGQVFGWFTNMTSVAGLLIWWSICLIYLRFYYAAKKQGFDRSELVYRAPLQPYLTYFTMVMLSLVLFFTKFTVFVNGHWDTADFVTSYLPIILFPVIFFVAYGWKRWIRRSPCQFWALQPLSELDLISGSRDEEEDDTPEATTKFGKFMNAIL
ncbi:hypothetical protein JCM8097_009289 [Rhodosporidiobolus ruineniae]